MRKTVFTSCVKAVTTLRVSSVAAYKIYTGLLPVQLAMGTNRRFIHLLTRTFAASLSTILHCFLSLLIRHLSPLPTGPIITTTIYINK